MTERIFANEEDFELLGFKKSEKFTVGGIMNLELSRGRKLSAMCIGQGNETIFLTHEDKNGDNDLVCIHNHDYDGFITWDRLQTIVQWFIEQNK